MQIKWTDLAVRDLDSIEEYIAHESNLSVALNVVLKILNTTELILPSHPYAGRLGRLAGTRELVIDGIPFMVIYRLKEQVQILRVLHDAQSWPN